MLLALLALVVGQVTPTLTLDKEIDDNSVAPLIAGFQEAARNHTPAVVLRINSPGGYKEAGYNLIHAMQAARAGGTKITCDVTEADSMAALLVESGACSRRVMHKGGVLMFHEAAYSFLLSVRGDRLTKEELRRLADILEREDAQDAELVAPQMHMTPAAYAEWVQDQDREVDAPTALARGFVDEVD